MIPSRLICAFAVSIVLCAAAWADEPFEVIDGDTYSVVVYVAGADSAPAVSGALQDQPFAEGAEGELLLQSLDGATLVQIIHWETNEAAAMYRAPYFPSAQVYWRREYRLVGAFAKEGELFQITADSAVQWSEFLVRDPALLPELGEIVEGIVEGMTLAGPDTLLATQQLTATNGLSIGLLARWADEEGFHVFEREQTFGDDPYWADYADNAHWMMRVLAIR